jgi:hypothetical protein
METKDKIYIALILTVLLALFYKGCSNENLIDTINKLENEKASLNIDLKANESIGSVKTTTTVRVDTVVETILKPTVERRDSFIFIPAQVDTLAIINKFFTQKYEEYNYIDTAIALSAYWNVYQNNVKFDSIIYKVFRKTVVQNNTVTILQHKFRWGIGIVSGYNQKFVFGPHINVSTKKINVGIGYDAVSNGTMISLDANFYNK